ncbi:hypothetical protein N7499_005639 [Penicillium canescens]|nr:hypothetical protein N7499_005639 [Penicillium canescens]
MVFKRLVRFAIGDRISFGGLLSVNGDTYKVRRLTGDPFTMLMTTEDIVQVDELLCPIDHTPFIIFVKPAHALAGPFDTIEIHPDAREMLDYEGELTVVVGRDAKNISENEALDYVLGYTAGNDLSARNFQLPEASGMQFGYSKSFDQFGPIGHTIVAASEIPDPQDLRLVTRVNGQVKQQTSTIDMIWSVRQIISHLSRGITLRKGTVIMTGTPAGVGFFNREFLKVGDVVEVEIEGVASVKMKSGILDIAVETTLHTIYYLIWREQYYPKKLCARSRRTEVATIRSSPLPVTITHHHLPNITSLPASSFTHQQLAQTHVLVY